MKIAQSDVEIMREALKPHIDRNMAGLGKITVDTLVDKINSLPDTTPEKALLVHFWNRLTLTLDKGNDEAVDGWLVALALATHTAGFLLPKAASRVKSNKALNPKAGGDATKRKAEARDKEIERVVEQKFGEASKVQQKWFGGLTNELNTRLKDLGIDPIAEATLVKKAGPILRKLKKA